MLAAAQEGAEWAWTRIYHSIADQLAGFAKAKGAPEPDDVVGEVLHDLARNIKSFEGSESNFRSWAFGIAHNRLVDQWRKAGRERQQQVMEPGQSRSAEAVALAGRADGPAFAALAGLTDQQRTVVILRTVADLSLEEVAAALEMKVNAVKATQHRAIKQLRKNLQEPVTK